MLILVTEYVGLYCPGRAGWDLLKYRIAMNTVLNIPTAFWLWIWSSQCFKALWSKASITGPMSQNAASLGALYDLLWTLQDLLGFCNITFAFLTVPEGAWRVPLRAAPGNGTHQWTWKLSGALTALSVDMWSLKSWRSTETVTIQTLITVSFTEIMVQGWEWKQLGLQELRFAVQLERALVKKHGSIIYTNLISTLLCNNQHFSSPCFATTVCVEQVFLSQARNSWGSSTPGTRQDSPEGQLHLSSAVEMEGINLLTGCRSKALKGKTNRQERAKGLAWQCSLMRSFFSMTDRHGYESCGKLFPGA